MDEEGISLEDALTPLGLEKVRAILFSEGSGSEFGVLSTDCDWDVNFFGGSSVTARGVPQFIPPVQPDENPTLFDDREVIDYSPWHKRRRWQ